MVLKSIWWITNGEIKKHGILAESEVSTTEDGTRIGIAEACTCGMWHIFPLPSNEDGLNFRFPRFAIYQTLQAHCRFHNFLKRLGIEFLDLFPWTTFVCPLSLCCIFLLQLSSISTRIHRTHSYLDSSSDHNFCHILIGKRKKKT
jgi:hypothetical protein